MTIAAAPSLSQLLAQARGGDAAARDRLFASCRNYLAIVARAEIGRSLQAKVDASDLVQQTLLDAHRGLTNFRGQTEGEWLGWLRQILNHNAADFVRHYRETAKRNVGHEVRIGPADSRQSGAAPFEPAAPGETPSELVVRREAELQMADAIVALPDDYQEVILLRNFERLPFDEVAQRMGRSRPPCRCSGCGRSRPSARMSSDSCHCLMAAARDFGYLENVAGSRQAVLRPVDVSGAAHCLSDAELGFARRPSRLRRLASSGMTAGAFQRFTVPL